MALFDKCEPRLFAGETDWMLHKGDCIPHMADLPENCFDMSVFSPPFPSLYAYTQYEEDIGNSEDLQHEAKLHLSFFYRQLVRVIKPGRVIVVHVAQIPRMKRSGGKGLFDFRGLNIRLGERAGLTFEYDWLIRKNPQAQAIRTKSRELQFAGFETDRAKCRGSIPDYLLKFRVPGENQVKLDNKETSRNDWIQWAEPAWFDIKETGTLNTLEGKGKDDTKHICPLQLEVIRRMVLLFSRPNEIVFSPFAGIGSEGYQSLLLGRRFYGCELKQEYCDCAEKNLDRAIRKRDQEQMPLFA